VSLHRIVVTGAPGSGKTTLTEVLAEDARYADWRSEQGGVIRVPESATATYAALGTRWDRLDEEGRCEVQRRIYRNQVRQEQAATRSAAAEGAGLILLDRGTIDGSAYWPDGPDAYWQDLGTTPESELARYDAVLLLESTVGLGLYDGDASNAVRFESPDEALANGLLLDRLWRPHPHRVGIPASPEFEAKVDRVAAVIAGLLSDRRGRQ
jgi:predicted ATPase